MCGLVGGNNTGKSNVLSAINLVLGDRWPSARSIDDRDIFGYDPEAEIVISMRLDQLGEVRGDVGDPVTFSGIQFKATRYRRRAGRHERGDLRSEFVCIDERGAAVQVLRRSTGSARPYPVAASVTAEFREELPAVFIDVDRNASYHLSGGQWSILGRLLRDVSIALKADRERFDEFRHRFDHAREVLRTPEFMRLHEKVVHHLKSHTGLDGIDVILDDVDPLNLYKSFSVLFQDAATPHPVDSERMGSGIQSAVVISLLQAYRELRRENAILLFEEPELFLHPHGRRHLFRLLTGLSDSGTQVIYTTHSQNFVDIERLDSIRLVAKTGPAGTQIAEPDQQFLPQDWRERLRIARHIAGFRNEVFFARCVILVEGVTEVAAIRILTDLLEPPWDLDRSDCSIIECGGVEGLPILASIARSLGKKVLVVYDTDSDKTDPQNTETNSRRQRAIIQAAGGEQNTYPLNPYLEAAAGVPGAVKQSIPQLMREFLSGMRGFADLAQPIRDLSAKIKQLIEQGIQ